MNDNKSDHTRTVRALALALLLAGSLAVLLGVLGMACGQGGTPAETATPAGPTPTAIWGVTYEDLARYPNGLYDKRVELSGQIVQIVSQTSSGLELRANITHVEYSWGDTWDDDVLLYYSGSLSERLLEDDVIRFIAIGRGLVEYETVLGAKRTIPVLEIVEVTRLGAGLQEEDW